MQVPYLGRAPRTKETLPDFLKWRRVTRHPLVFRRLTGSQRTPRFWGVTLSKLLSNFLLETSPEMSSSGTVKSSSSTSHPHNYHYDVFLSFRGADTRKTFTDHLYDNLVAHGIHTFRDDEELENGGDIVRFLPLREDSN